MNIDALYTGDALEVLKDFPDDTLDTTGIITKKSLCRAIQLPYDNIYNISSPTDWA